MFNATPVIAFVKEAFQDGNRASFSRMFSVPFLVGSFALSMADGIVSLYHHNSALDAAGSLALMGITLFTGSKALSIRGTKFSGQMGGGEAPEAIPEKKKDAEG